MRSPMVSGPKPGHAWRDNSDKTNKKPAASPAPALALTVACRSLWLNDPEQGADEPRSRGEGVCPTPGADAVRAPVECAHFVRRSEVPLVLDRFTRKMRLRGRTKHGRLQIALSPR